MDNKAVSPVIATVLLVAIAVVLAAILMAILTGFAHKSLSSLEESHTPPQATLPTNDTTNPPPGNPPHKEAKWSVEPLPGYECEYRIAGLRDYYCVPIGA